MKHIIPILEGTIIFLALETILLKPTWLIYILLLTASVIFLGVLLPKKKFSGKNEFWHYLASPLIFVWSGTILLLFFENVYFKHFFVLGLGAYILFYFENFLYYLIVPSDESRDSFLRINNLMNVVSIFFLSASFYGIKTFIQLHLWLLSIIFFIFSLGLIYGPLWTLKKKTKIIIPEMLIAALIITELFTAIQFLPIGFYASGALVGILYYILSGVLINYLKYKKIVYRRYIIVGLILLFLILFTARWV
ncbi:MAG: hypothetical protein COU51_00745 [Parcubacteria group bacterium CG10_big_fil_rev_8_21_14_0_10_36_14]|nr:MAG: hypothetical protein COU51_00745 [Parcubacteria group bacterium CG10_big_fil_rev_8_21_14_0_10_36_14]